MSIETLLQAAEFLDRREREAEHGYASTLPVPVRSSNRRKTSKQRKSQGSKSMHNELEKNRRAQLRYFLEQLKNIVPLGPDSSRHTTLRLLTDARSLIKSLEETNRYQRQLKDQLVQEQKSLRWELARQTAGMYRPRFEHSLSESSSASSASVSSSFSAGDEVDITSLSSTGLSDSEDQTSSSSSSSGINDLRL